MLEYCLENKIIYEFLTLYEHSFWKKLIPSLLEIAILNLKSSFNTLLFSEKDINNIIRDLKIKQKISYDFNNNQKSIQEKNKDKEKKNILYYKHFTESNTIDGLGDQDKTNNYIHCHSDKRKYKHINSKIKNLIDKDKRNYYYTNSENYLINNYNYNPRKRINYAISYDRNLTPEIIERTTFRNSKKGGKKIVQKMTQEEYEKKYNEDNIDNNEIYNEKNKSKKLFHSQGPNKIKNIDINGSNLSPYKSINSYNYSKICIKNRSPKMNNQSEKKNNLYHYKIRYSNQKNNNNNILIKNTKMANCGNYKNNMKNNIIEINANSLKDFGKHYFKSQNNKNQKKINHFKIRKNNKIINTDNNITSEERNNINNTYNSNNDFYLNKNLNCHKNSYIDKDNDKDRDSDSEFIGIEKIYEKKVDELEKNILNTYNKYLKNLKIINEKNLNKKNNNPVINRLKVNTINLKDYAMKRKKKNKIFKKNYNEQNYEESVVGNRTDINNEKKEKNISNEKKELNDINNENRFLS
jgi:hypothetical protein